MTSIHHHIALQVSDMDRGIDFYVSTLDAIVLTLPVSYGGEAAEEVMLGPAEYRHCMLGFDDGVLELFEFAADRMPDWARGQELRCVPHFGVVVADVQASLARIEAAGGQRVWAQPHVWETNPPTEIIYAADPDGNNLELINASIGDVVERVLRMHPEANPNR